MVDSNAFVEDIAIPFPLALLLRDIFEVFEDAAFKVINMFVSLLEHPCGGLLAADPSCAEHRDFLVDLGIEVFVDELREISEACDLRIDRALECPGVVLVVIARVDEHDFWIRDQIVPVLGVDILANKLVRIDRFVDLGAETDERWFDFNLGAIEDMSWRVAGLVWEVFETCVGTHDLDEFFDGAGESADRAVDAFLGEENGSHDVTIKHVLLEDRRVGIAVVDLDELVECDHLVCRLILGHLRHGRFNA